MLLKIPVEAPKRVPTSPNIGTAVDNDMLKIETSWQTAARGGMGGDELENAPLADRLT